MTVSSIPLDSIQPAITPTDFRDDYRRTKQVQAKELILPAPNSLQPLLDQVTAKLLISPAIIRQMCYALASGKHVVLYGPPGTGKTTLASEVAERVFGVSTEIRTASADWTTFDTIGGICVRSEKGYEVFEPSDGCITEAILNCCNQIMAAEISSEVRQASWLILDELNRAKIDYVLGDMFTAMDAGDRAAEKARIALDHYRGSNRPQNTEIYIPRRFRIIGTMNTYDKNYLFRLSYALTRRFAFVYIPVPEAGDWEKELDIVCVRAAERVKNRLGGLAGTLDANDIKNQWGYALELLRSVVQQVRGEEGDQLGRKIGTAQVLDLMTYVVTALLIGQDTGEGAQRGHLDRALLAYIVPQLEGLRRDALSGFAIWLGQNALPESCRGVKDLTQVGF